MTRRLQDKIAVITGGNSGIGRAAAEAFAAEGAQVVVFGRNRQRLDETVSALGDRAIAVAGDVAKLDDLARLFAVVKERFGRVDALLANAGVSWQRPFEEVDETFFDDLFAINVKGLYFTVQKAAPLMPRGGSVILTGSAAVERGIPNLSVYSASKGAVRSLARTLSAALVGRGLRVNVLTPGPIETPSIARSGLPPEQVEAFSEKIRESLPIGRFGRPEEAAAAAVFLASDASSFMLGAEVAVDGGMAQI